MSDAEKLSNAIQLLAVLIEKLGGEVVVSRRDFDMMEDVPVVGRDIGSYIILRLKFEDEASCVDFLPFDKG